MAIPSRAILEVKFKYIVNNQTLMNVIHFTNLTGYPAENPTLVVPELLDVIAGTGPTSWVAAFAAAQSQDVAWSSVSCQLVYPDRYIVFEKDVAYAGQVVSACTAQNVQASVEKYGELGVRNNVGGFHLGGLPVNGYSGGLLTGGQKALMDSIAGKLLDPLDEATYSTHWTPCIQNKTPIPNTDPVRYQISGSTIIYGTLAKQPLRTMRRRTVGLGI